MILSVPQGAVHGSTQATFVTVYLRAVDKLLLTEVVQLSRLKEATSLDETCSCKGPIRTTNVLILDGSDSTLVDPADGSEWGLRVVPLASELSQLLVIAHEELALGLCPVRETVVAHRGGARL